MKERKGIGSALTLRALLFGAFLSVIVASYSAYAGLKIGGVYWPIVTTSLISMVFFLFLGKTNVNEINVAQTAGSAGGLLAAGIIFTIPAIWLLGLEINLLEIFLISLIGGITGIIFSIPLRKKMIEEDKLPYADGTAAASLIKAGDEGGKKARILFYAFGIGAVFSFIRDFLQWIPAAINLDMLKLKVSNLFSFGSSVSLIPFAGGFLIGPRFTAAWFLGAIITYFVIIPYYVSTGLIAEKFAVLAEIARPLGVGIVIGSAIMYFIIKGIPSLRKLFSSWKDAKTGKLSGIALIFAVGILTIITNMNLPLAIIAIVGAFLMAFVGARVTGEMNVDPMEIFAMIVLLIAKIFFGFNAIYLVMVAAVVCIAAGIAGDLMQDLKTGFILKTKPEHQVIAQLVGIITASCVIGIVLFAIKPYGFGGVEFPAPQAIAVSEVLGPAFLSFPLLVGVLLGIIFTLITSLVLKMGIIPIAFGIGLYVPIELSLPLFIGGMVRLVADRKKITEKARLVAAGVISGEALIGVIIAIAGLVGGMLA